MPRRIILHFIERIIMTTGILKQICYVIYFEGILPLIIVNMFVCHIESV